MKESYHTDSVLCMRQTTDKKDDERRIEAAGDVGLLNNEMDMLALAGENGQITALRTNFT